MWNLGSSSFWLDSEQKQVVNQLELIKSYENCKYFHLNSALKTMNSIFVFDFLHFKQLKAQTK